MREDPSRNCLAIHFMRTLFCFTVIGCIIALLAAKAWAHKPSQLMDGALPPAQVPYGKIIEDEWRGGGILSVDSWREWDAATGNWGGVRTKLQEQGIDLFGGYTAEVWGNRTGGMRTGVVSTHLFDFGVELDLEKRVGWRGATVHNSWFAPIGKDLSSEYVGNLFTVSNAAAFNSLYLYEFWLQQNFADSRIIVRVGQLAADAEFAGSDYGALFLNATFGWPPFLSSNIPNVGPAFPKGTLGVSVGVQLLDWLTLQSAVYQGDPFADDVNRHGFRWRLDRGVGVFWISEAQVCWNQDDSPTGLPGQMKGGFWYHSSRFASADASPGKSYSGNHGFYIVVDQMLYRDREAVSGGHSDWGLGWFGRVAVNPQDRNFIGFYLDTGLTYKGLISSREEDVWGVAFAYGHLSKGARRTLRDEGSRGVGAEMVVEVSYYCQLTPWMSVQPDIQWIVNPGAVKDHGNALVLGVRASVVF